jgi:hypothetical protein
MDHQQNKNSDQKNTILADFDRVFSSTKSDGIFLKNVFFAVAFETATNVYSPLFRYREDAVLHVL